MCIRDSDSSVVCLSSLVEWKDKLTIGRTDCVGGCLALSYDLDVSAVTTDLTDEAVDAGVPSIDLHLVACSDGSDLCGSTKGTLETSV